MWSGSEKEEEAMDAYGDRTVAPDNVHEGICYLMPQDESPDAAWALAMDFRLRGMLARVVTSGAFRRVVRVEECRPQTLQKMVGDKYKVMVKVGRQTRTFQTLDGETVKV